MTAVNDWAVNYGTYCREIGELYEAKRRVAVASRLVADLPCECSDVVECPRCQLERVLAGDE